MIARRGQVAADISAVAGELAKYAAIRVAHSAANYRAPMRAAVEQGVDLIEADVWPRWNHVVARHERGVIALPLVFDKWYVRPEIRPITLQEVAETVGGRAGLYLDLKSDNHRYLRHIVEIVQRFGLTARTAITSPHWHALRHIEAMAPEVSSYYTVIARRHLEPFFDHLDEYPEVNGTAIRHGLVSPALIEAFHARGLRILTWTIDSPARALELLSWGVDGIISNRLDLLAAIPARGPEAA
ncbi:MAG: glycerophosphodiester phosphodiesterase [Dehalococcoidia bacterium]